MTQIQTVGQVYKQEYNELLSSKGVPKVAELVRKILPSYLAFHDQQKFVHWRGNCCKQMAMIIAAFYKEMLNTNDPRSDYKTPQVFEGQFEDVIDGNKVSYNHCWTFVQHKIDPAKSWFVDQGRQHHTNLCFQTTRNQYPIDQGYEHMFCFMEEEVDWQKEMLQKEYYTHKTGEVIKTELLSLIQDAQQRGQL